MKKLQIAVVATALSLCSVPLFSCSDEKTQTPSISLVEPSDDIQDEISNDGGSPDDTESESDNTESESDDTDNDIGKFKGKYSSDSHINDSDFNQDIEVNDTVFSVYSVVRVEKEESDYIYIGVKIQNKTDKEYTISSLNNFFVDTGNGEEISTNVITKQLALAEFTKCVNDPVTITANGEFSGYLAGGFVIPKDTETISVGFFPTLDDNSDKSECIVVPVSAENIVKDPSIIKE